jgi:hypothetical protein
MRRDDTAQMRQCEKQALALPGHHQAAAPDRVSLKTLNLRLFLANVHCSAVLGFAAYICPAMFWQKTRSENPLRSA